MVPTNKIPFLTAAGADRKIDYQDMLPYGYVFRVGRSTAYSIGAAAGEPIAWDNLIYDTGGFSGWDADDYTMTIPKTGLWMFTIELKPTVTADANPTWVYLYQYPALSVRKLQARQLTAVNDTIRAVGFVPVAAGTVLGTFVATTTDGVTFSATEADSNWTGVLVSPQTWGLA